jgi:histidine triad (HIT) family protein
VNDCVFCRIAAGEIPANFVASDDRCVAFHDLDPQAPLHLLVIPRRHLSTLAAADAEDAALLGHLLVVARDLAARLGLDGGFRVVINSGEAAGQSVFHLHVHLLGGRRLGWPPG